MAVDPWLLDHSSISCALKAVVTAAHPGWENAVGTPLWAFLEALSLPREALERTVDSFQLLCPAVSFSEPDVFVSPKRAFVNEHLSSIDFSVRSQFGFRSCRDISERVIKRSGAPPSILRCTLLYS